MVPSDSCGDFYNHQSALSNSVHTLRLMGRKFYTEGMNIFKSTRFTWWQLGILKWTTLFFGIAVGSTWPDVFAPYALILLLISIVAGIYLGLVWLKKK